MRKRERGRDVGFYEFIAFCLFIYLFSFPRKLQASTHRRDGTRLRLRDPSHSSTERGGASKLFTAEASESRRPAAFLSYFSSHRRLGRRFQLSPGKNTKSGVISADLWLERVGKGRRSGKAFSLARGRDEATRRQAQRCKSRFERKKKRSGLVFLLLCHFFHLIFQPHLFRLNLVRFPLQYMDGAVESKGGPEVPRHRTSRCHIHITVITS